MEQLTLARVRSAVRAGLGHGQDSTHRLVINEARSYLVEHGPSAIIEKCESGKGEM